MFMFKHNKKLIIIFLSAFFFVGLCLYVLFIVGDFTNVSPYLDKNAIKYSVVVLSFVFSLLSFLFVAKEKKDILHISLLAIGLLITSVSDFILVIINKYYEIAVGIFIFAHIAYFIMEIFLFGYKEKEVIIYTSIRLALTIIGLIILAATNIITLLYALVIIYLVELVMNCAQAFIYFFKTKRIDILILAIGFLLFIGCDIFVGLDNTIYRGIYIIAWLFYFPSQLLIASSYLFDKIINTKE